MPQFCPMVFVHPDYGYYKIVTECGSLVGKQITAINVDDGGGVYIEGWR